jgi:predicted MPP superfamily phosphohydrolase
MEELVLGESIAPTSEMPSIRAPKREVEIRLKKEAEIHSHGIPPAYPGIVTSLVKRFPPKNWLPQTLFYISKYSGKQARKNVTDFELNHKIMYVKGLPKPLKGLKILHISDLHLDLIPSFGESVKRFLQKNKQIIELAQVALITGDTQEKYADPVTVTLKAFKKLVPEIPCPIIASLGNHDSLNLADEISKVPHHGGIRFLVNEQIKFKGPKGCKINIQGIDDPYYYKSYKFHKKQGEDLNILLAHSPQVYQEAHLHGIDICLSGHTHGGQIKIPGIGSIVNRANVPKKYIEGLWEYKTLKGHTSRGVGCSSVPLRINCPPEITIIEIR